MKKQNDVRITISKVDEDNFVGGVAFKNKMGMIYATDYIQALDQAKEWLIQTLSQEKPDYIISTNGKGNFTSTSQELIAQKEAKK